MKFLRAAALRHPGRTSMIWIPQGVSAETIAEPSFAPPTWNVAQTLARATQLAAQFRSWGVAPGERVVVIGKNSPWHLLTFVAAAAIPAITVPLDQNLPAPELVKILAHCEPKIIICDPAQHKKLSDCDPTAGPRPRLVTYSDLEDCLAPHDDSTPPVTLALAATKMLDDLPECGDDVPGAIIYTSGTSAHPKGTLLTYKNMWWGCTNFREVFEYSPATVEAVTAPLSHIGGFNGTTTDIFSHGGTVVIFEKFDSAAVLAAIEKYRVQMMFAVPTMYRMLVREVRQAAQSGRPIDTSRFTKALVGGAPWDEQLAADMIGLGWNPINIWGMTEQSASGAALTTDVMAGRELAVGRAFPHTELRAVDSAEKPVEPGVIGQLECRGPSVTREYFRNPELNAALIDPQTGWLRTGDLGFFDADGFLHLVGRLTDTINSGGEKVFSQRVAAVLSRHPGVSEARVVGVPDPTWGEIVAAVVVQTPDTPEDAEPLSLEQLQDFARPHLTKAELPRALRLVSHIPLNSNGKPDRQGLLALFQ